MKTDQSIRSSDLKKKITRLWKLSAEKIRLIEKNYDPRKGSPVFTVKGAYTTRGWTEWTQGFQYGSAILQYDATGEADFLEAARRKTV
jgi:hypothetical protein